MILFELDDFDYWVEHDVVSGNGEATFSPMFVFLIDWAAKRNCLDESFTSSSVMWNLYQDMVAGKVSMTEFVLDALDGKLLADYFSESVRGFISDYVEYDGYSKDLVDCFKVNMWELPHDLNESETLYRQIDRSFKNYSKNLMHNPDIVSFD